MNKLVAFWLCVIVASICNLLTATAQGMDTMTSLALSPRIVYIITVILIASAVFILRTKDKTESIGAPLWSLKSLRLQQIVLWINLFTVLNPIFNGIFKGTFSFPA